MELASKEKALVFCSFIHALLSFPLYLVNTYFASRVHAGISHSGRPALSLPSSPENHTDPHVSPECAPGRQHWPARGRHYLTDAPRSLVGFHYQSTPSKPLLFLPCRWANKE